MYKKTNEKEVKRLYKESGKSVDAVVKTLGVSQATVYRYLKLKTKVKHGRKNTKISGKPGVSRKREFSDQSGTSLE